MINVLKIVTSEEMARIEKGQKGHEQFMQEAGKKVAEAAIEFIEEAGLPKDVTLLVGRGNNGGDAYAAGIYLLDEGYKVRAIAVPGSCSALNEKFKDRFQKKRGKFEEKFEGLMIDGLLGTGFKGKVDDATATIIDKANQSNWPILAIDIPSGVNGSTGEVLGSAIAADETITLGLPKIGLFLRDGWNHVGALQVADFGLPEAAIAEADAIAYLPIDFELPNMNRNRHKYQAGYVVGFGGSKAFKGAVKLAGFSALRSGAGIVRIFHPEEIGEAPNELICNEWNEKEWKKETERARAVFVGPGIGLAKNMSTWMKTHLKKIKCPCVIDAEALVPNAPFPKMAILTPHRGEILRLLKIKAAPREEELFAKIIRFCEEKEVIIVLKGAPTFIFVPKHKPFVVPAGDPGMATAGAGDVLTGVLSGLLAQELSPMEAAILGVALHGIAGEAAAEQKTSYCMTATDLIDFMPAAFASLM